MRADCNMSPTMRGDERQKKKKKTPLAIDQRRTVTTVQVYIYMCVCARYIRPYRWYSVVERVVCEMNHTIHKRLCLSPGVSRVTMLHALMNGTERDDGNFLFVSHNALALFGRRTHGRVEYARL